MAKKENKRKPKLNLDISGGKDSSKTIYGGGYADVEIPVSENVTLRPYVIGGGAKGPWGSAESISEYGGGLEYSFKKGGKVKKCKRDGIAMRGKTKAGR